MTEVPFDALSDTFAQIAVQRRTAWRADLVQPEPPSASTRTLPLKRSTADAPWPIRRRIDTPAKLQRALVSARKSHARFLKNHAPVLPAFRESLDLRIFDWRIETPADRTDFTAVLDGHGSWEKVTIPHYGPPEGRAVTYYRTTFEINETMLQRGAIALRFRGVDYKAHAFVNSAYLGSHEGFFAPFEFDCTAHVRRGTNVLVIKVENDSIIMGNGSWEGPAKHTEGDKIYAATGPGYDEPEVGWHHCPPGMGVYQAVSIEARPRIHLSDIFVRPLLDEARAEARIEVWNADVTGRNIRLDLSVYGRNFRQTVYRNIRWTPRTVQVPGLSDMPKPGDNDVLELTLGPGVNYFTVPISLPAARRWTPAEPWLYQLQVELLDENGVRMDSAERQFGMRSFRMDETSQPKGLMLLNSEPVRLRGANTMGFEQLCVMRGDLDRLRDDILLAKLCNMNFLRLTQRPVQDEVYDWCDRLGLMTQTDLPLFGCLRRNQFNEAVRQAGEMERLVRSHPCNILVSYINEPFPNAQAKPHRNLTRAELTDFFKAADLAVKQANPDRVTKPVDGDYDPPAPGLPDTHCYSGWYIGNGLDLGELHKGRWQRVKPGWYYGCGEFGAEGLDPENTMRSYYPREWLPDGATDEARWSPQQIAKSQTGAFHHLWFETPDTLAGWIERSQLHQAWVTKLMAEAFRRDSRMISCAIHLFIDAFPAGWMKTIMDVDRQPKPAYFAYLEALSPLMVSLRSDRRAFFGGTTAAVEVWICNDRNHAPRRARLMYRAELDGRVIARGETAADTPVFGSRCQGLIKVELPRVPDRGTLKVTVTLVDVARQPLHDSEINFDVFPPYAPITAAVSGVRIVGMRNGMAAKLAGELQLAVSRGAATLLIDDFAAFERDRQAITAAVREGATVIFLDLPSGTYDISGTAVHVRKCDMGARHFVSRASGHSLVAGFEREDFKFWFDTREDRPTPLLQTAFEAQGWNAVLVSGNGSNAGTQPSQWRAVFAAAEKTEGQGVWRICQVSLAGRIRGNPVAEIFARRLLTS
jgi:hypothetical protein